MTLSSLYEMTRSFTEGRTITDPLPQAEVDRQLAIWTALAEHIRPWHQVVTREEHPAILRKQYLAMHGVCHQAIAAAVAPLLPAEGDPGPTISRLGLIDWRIANPEWQGVAIQGRHVNNTSTTIRNLSGLLSLKIGGDVESTVADSLIAIINGRGDQPPAELMRFTNGE
jgi:hypothetical protein